VIAVRRVLLVRLLPVVVALAAAGALLAALDRTAVAGSDQLPDLDQATPAGLEITRAGRVWRLGFRSAVSNVGDGPLVIEAHRSGTDVATMTADQLVDREGAPRQVVGDVGKLRFVVSPDHRHWHLLGFDRYELRRAGRPRRAVRDRKSGFCLGDRYATLRRPPAAPSEAVYTSRCGLASPGLLGITQGISVGYGDDYAANLEGQYLPLNGLRAGRWVLVHRANGDRRLRERDYSNNAASLLLQLRWRRGAPMVRVLRSCPSTDRCDRNVRID
jgi:Lysyl oxidase